MARIIKNVKGQYNYDASLQKLKTKFEDELMYLTTTSIHAEVREKWLSISYDVLRKMSEKLSMVSMIINTREQQITPFLSPVEEINQPGFIVYKKGSFDKRLKKKDKRSEEIMDMINQTGFIYDPLREDDFIDFGKMLVREILVIDQVAIELQRNRIGEVSAFWLTDGATIRRCTEKGYEGIEKYQFVQVMEEKVVTAYTREELLFDYMFKRTNIMHRGYGYPLLEQAVDLITTLILGITYNRDLFTKEKIPKGFIALQGEADREAIEAVERYWYMAMSGVGAKFTVPIIPSGKEGVSLDFKTMGQSNREMEYSKLMLFFLSLFAAVFGLDLAELGIKTDTTQPLIGENVEGRIKYSKDRGLTSLLSFITGIMNKIVRKVDEDYVFRFLGADKEDEQKKYTGVKSAVESNRTVNEMREEDGLEKLKGEENDTVLNPQLIQLKQNLAMAQQQEEGEEYEEEEGGGEYEREETEENSEKDKKEEKKETKESGEEETEKSQQALEKHLDNLIKAGYDLEIKV